MSVNKDIVLQGTGPSANTTSTAACVISPQSVVTSSQPLSPQNQDGFKPLDSSWMNWFKSVRPPSPESTHHQFAVKQVRISEESLPRSSTEIKSNAAKPTLEKNLNENLDVIPTAETLDFSSDIHSHEDTKKQPANSFEVQAPKQDIERLTSSTAIESDDSCAKQNAVLHKGLCSCCFMSLIKKHPCLTILFVAIFCVVVAVVAIVVILFVVPHIIQSTLDATNISVVHAILTDPKAASFQLSTELLLKRPRGDKVLIDPFESKVYFVPSSDTSLFARRRLNTNYESYDSGFFSAISQYKNRFDSPSLRNSLKSNALRFLSNLDNNERHLIGHIKLPETTLEGRSSTIKYNSTFYLMNHLAFNEFLQELVEIGHAEWVMEGKPIVHVHGFSYNNIQFTKTLNIYGPQLNQPKAQLDELIKAGGITGTLDRIIPKTYRTNITNELNNNKPNNSNNKKIARRNNKSLVQILAIDMTQKSGDNILVKLKAELDNSNSQSIINPLGNISLAELFAGAEFFQLHSINPIELSSGINRLEFQGILPKLDNLGIQEREALVNLLSVIVQGNTPILETKGLTCSTPLYDAAIKTIHLYTPLKNLLQQEQPTKVDDGANDINALSLSLSSAQSNSTPLIKNIDVHNLKVIPGPDLESQFSLLGNLTLELLNPFGKNMPINLMDVHMKGSVYVNLPKRNNKNNNKSLSISKTNSKILNSDELQLGNFSGRLHTDTSQHYFDAPKPPSSAQSKSESTLVYGIQKLHVQMYLNVDLLDHLETDFNAFVREFVSQSNVVTSLKNTAATVEADTPLGVIHFNDVPLNENIIIQGIGGFSDLRLEGFEMGSLALLSSLASSSPSSSTGFDIHVSVMMVSKAPITLYLGTLAVDLHYRGEHLTYLISPSCNLKPGENIFKFTGTVHLRQIDLSKILPLIANYISGKTNVVEVRFVHKSDIIELASQDEGPPAPKWIENALVGTSILIPLPGLGSNRFGEPLLQNDQQTEVSNNGNSTTTKDDSEGFPLFRRGGLMHSILNGIRSAANLNI